MTQPTATFTDNELVLSNALVERRYRLRNGLLHATALLDRATGQQWIQRQLDQPLLQLAPDAAAEDARTDLTTFFAPDHPVEPPALVAELRVGDRVYRFKLFPDSPAVVSQLITPTRSADVAPSAEDSADAPTGVEEAPKPAARPTVLPDVLDAFAIDPLHVRVTAVDLVDRTDIHDTLAHETRWLMHPAETVRARGAVFYLEHVLTGRGLILLKLAPLPHARPVKTEHDLIVRPDGQLALLGHGIGASGGAGYAAVTLPYAGGTPGRIAALQAFHRLLRPYVAGRDGQFLSNTWGDRSKDGALNEPFMMKEIDAGARLGVDVIQIDDGWQRGRTANSVEAGGVWNGFWAADDRFWTPHESRFPNGLEPLVAAARERGMRFGLWYAPDSSNDFANWQRDADQLLALHRSLNIDYFKIDGVKMHSTVGAANLDRLFTTCLRESAGRITFDLDATAETRPSYLGLPHVGPIFVENRYTDWHRYWPHRTLRNLWTLAHHLDPVRLRMEFLNVARNADKYPNDPLAPAAYSPDHLFATVMMASPLGWFEISNLPESYIAQAGPLIATWKQHRAALHAGTILPLGDEPDGAAWTGFASIAPDRRSAYILLFRQHHPHATRDLALPLIQADLSQAKVLGGTGTLTASGATVRAHLPTPLSYLWAHVS